MRRDSLRLAPEDPWPAGGGLPPGPPPGSSSGPPPAPSLDPAARDAGTAELLDPAHQSLSEAIRITFRILQVAMVVLAVLFAFSGFQSVREGEKGIRLLFGKVRAANLDPGFRFSFPYPVGELVKVNTGAVNVSVDRAFWPFVEESARGKPVDQLPRASALNPANDGSLLTADNNIAHTQWSVVYRRDKPEQYAQNVFTEDERKLVMMAVQRGIVHATAQVTIDDLLKQSAGDAGSVASRAKEIAQRMLTKAESGLIIEQLALDQKMPPMYVRDKFNNVQAAASNASKKREEAETERQRLLNTKAGAAAETLIAGIDEYERAVDLNDAAAKSVALDKINTVLEGRAGEASPRVSGAVTALLNDARQYRSDTVNQARSQLTVFNAKLEQFENNPLIIVHREWADALTKFLDRDSVQQMWLPEGTTTLELVISPDPDVLKELDQAQKRREAEIAQETSARLKRAARFNTDTGLLQASPR